MWDKKIWNETSKIPSMYGATATFWALASPTRRFYSSPAPPPRPVFSNSYKIAEVTAIFYLAGKWIYIGIFQIYFPIAVNFDRRGFRIMCLSTDEFRKNWRPEGRNF